jgi:hypothetical protein
MSYAQTWYAEHPLPVTHLNPRAPSITLTDGAKPSITPSINPSNRNLLAFDSKTAQLQVLDEAASLAE